MAFDILDTMSSELDYERNRLTFAQWMDAIESKYDTNNLVVSTYSRKQSKEIILRFTTMLGFSEMKDMFEGNSQTTLDNTDPLRECCYGTINGKPECSSNWEKKLQMNPLLRKISYQEFINPIEIRGIKKKLNF